VVNFTQLKVDSCLKNTETWIVMSIKLQKLFIVESLPYFQPTGGGFQLNLLSRRTSYCN